MVNKEVIMPSMIEKPRHRVLRGEGIATPTGSMDRYISDDLNQATRYKSVLI